MIDALRQYLQHRDPRNQFISHFEDGKEVGLAAFQEFPNGMYLHEVFVMNGHRQTGIGKKLLKRVIVISYELGFEKLYASVNAQRGDPTASLKACLACGFKVTGADPGSIVLEIEVQDG